MAKYMRRHPRPTSQTWRTFLTNQANQIMAADLFVVTSVTATRTKHGYLRVQFVRIKSRRGAKKAILAVASSMLTVAYFILRDGVEYHDLGAHHSSNVTKNNPPTVSFSASPSRRRQWR